MLLNQVKLKREMIKQGLLGKPGDIGQEPPPSDCLTVYGKFPKQAQIKPQPDDSVDTNIFFHQRPSKNFWTKLQQYLSESETDITKEK